tara:strand:- start:2854 stop:5004 length:2151 start_codon:yes stop_codon:yes gene_type:complete
MATTIKIKRGTGTSAPSSLSAGELAYTGGSGTNSNGGSRLYVGNPADGSVLVIGGKYFADLADHAPGTLTASSAIITDTNNKIDNLLVDNLQLNGNTMTSTGALTITTNAGLTINHSGAVDVSAQTNEFSIKDNEAASVNFTEGSNSYIKLVTTDSSEKVVIGQDITFADDVSLVSDAAVLNFGADSEVNLTHVADVGLLLNSDNVIQFRDNALSIGSTADGQLDIVADTQLEITTPTVEFNTDGQVIAVGADGDVTLTHIADAGLRLNTAMGLQFRDSALVINSSTDGQLDIDADAELELTAPIVDINASTSVNISNDLKLDSDSAVLGFGADNDVTLTHVADTALMLNSAIALRFRDSALSVSSPSDGTLAIAADTEVDITATNIDINGNTDISGSLNVGATTASTLIVSDLTNNRVVIAGTSGEVEDDANFTFDGTTLALTAGMNITGDLDVDNVNVNSNTVSTTNSNGDLLLSPNGTGTVKVPSGYKDRTGFTSDSLVSKEYVDAVKQSLDIKDSVRVASTGNLNIASDLQNGDTLDGVTLATGNRVLLKSQSTASQNGIYVVVASGAASRSTDANASADVTSGMFVWVEEGTANGDQGYVLTTNDVISLNTTSLTFTQFSGAGQITAGTGMTKSGNTLNVGFDNITIEDNSDSLRIKGITTTALGDLLIGKASNAGYKRLAASTGGAHQLLRLNSAGTDLEYTNTLDGGTF